MIKDSQEKVEDVLPRGKVIGVLSKNVTLAKTNFVLISALTKNENSKILFFAMEKPHQYMSYLLGINGISQRNITYIFAENSEASNISFPITQRNMNGLKLGGFMRRDVLIIQDYDYIIIDNIAFLVHMWTWDNIKRFIATIVDDAKASNVSVIFTFKQGTKIEDIMKDTCDILISIDEVMK